MCFIHLKEVIESINLIKSPKYLEVVLHIVIITLMLLYTVLLNSLKALSLTRNYLIIMLAII